MDKIRERIRPYNLANPPLHREDFKRQYYQTRDVVVIKHCQEIRKMRDWAKDKSLMDCLRTIREVWPSAPEELMRGLPEPGEWGEEEEHEKAKELQRWVDPSYDTSEYSNVEAEFVSALCALLIELHGEPGDGQYEALLEQKFIRRRA
jgi:hypothetical protein